MPAFLLRSGLRQCIVKLPLRLIWPAESHQCFRLSFIAHEGEPRVLISLCEPDGSFETHQCFARAVDLYHAVSQHLQKADLTARVAVSHCRDERRTQELGPLARISFQEGNDAQFTRGPGRPSVVPKTLCNLLGLQPVLFLRLIVNLDVGVAFCGEAPESQSSIVAHDWVLQLVVQESR